MVFQILIAYKKTADSQDCHITREREGAICAFLLPGFLTKNKKGGDRK